MATGAKVYYDGPRRFGAVGGDDMPGVEGFMYPNEVELQWSVLIVLYPFITGLVAGAFILASLERVFKVEAVQAHLPPGAAHGAGLSARGAAAAATAPRPPRALVRDVPDAAHLVGHGDVRLRLPLVPDGGAAARDLARLPTGYRARADAQHGPAADDLHGAHAGVREHQSAARCASTTRSAARSPSSASPRRSCCTATSASSSGPSRPTPGGPRR